LHWIRSSENQIIQTPLSSPVHQPITPTALTNHNKPNALNISQLCCCLEYYLHGLGSADVARMKHQKVAVKTLIVHLLDPLAGPILNE
jgi:hypothetical protein